MASTRRIVRKALVEVIEGKTATAGERLKACRLLLKLALAPKGKPRGRAFPKKGESKPRTINVNEVFSDLSNENGGKSLTREEFLKQVGLR